MTRNNDEEMHGKSKLVKRSGHRQPKRKENKMKILVYSHNNFVAIKISN